MRKTLFTLVLSCAFLFGYSQYYYIPHLDNPGNPGKLNQTNEFPLGGGLDPSWVSILGGGQFVPAWSAVQPMPFAFKFNDQVVGGYKVSSSGVLTFDIAAATPPPGVNGNLPSAQIPDRSICIWGLAGPGSNDNIVVQTFGTAPNRQHWVFFASYNYQGGGASCWHYYSIVMEETTNKIYLVDQRHTTGAGCAPALTMGVQIDANTATQVTGSPFLQPVAGSDPSDADNNYYEFVQGVQPQYDLSVTNITTGPVLGLGGAPYSITGDITNFGSETVSLFQLNYRINGGATQTAASTGAPMQPFSGRSFTHGTQWSPSGDGEYLLEVWASEIGINAYPDQNRSNDTLSVILSVAGRTIDRVPIFEDFTSSTCPPCLPGAQQIEAILGVENPETYTLLSYQMSWPGTGDPYFTDEGNVRRNYYGVTGIPNMTIDGGVNLNPQSLTKTLYDDARAVPSFIEMQVTHTVDTATMTVAGEVQLNPMVDFPGQVISHIAIVEDTTHLNIKNNGQTEFPMVMKKMVPDASGTAINGLQKGVPYRYNFSYTFQGSFVLPPDANSPIDHTTQHSVEDFENLQVIVFLQDAASTEIYNSAHSSPTCPNSTNMSVTAAAQSVACPGDLTGSLSATNATGGTMPYSYVWSNGSNGDMVSNVSAGTYSVTVTDANGCKAFATATVNSSNPAMNVGIQGTLLQCADDSNGVVTLNVSGGTMPYTYLWNTNETTQNLANKPAGLYSVTITDANNCTQQATASVDQPPAIVIDGTASTPDNGSDNGTASVSVLGGGTSPYFYLWNTSPPQNMAMATGLAAGTYTCTVIDNNGCEHDVDVTVESNVGIQDLLAAGVSNMEVYPNPSNGNFSLRIELAERDELVISVVDLNGQQVYRHEAGTTQGYQDELNLSDLAAGLYFVQVQTSRGQGAQKIVIE